MTTPRRKQRGITLLEVMLSLTIMSAVFLGINAITERFTKDTQNTIAASHLRTFGDAAKAYIKANSEVISANITEDNPLVLIDYDTLDLDNRLPAGFTRTNTYGQYVCAVVRQVAPNTLQALVVAEGGSNIDDFSLGAIALLVGGKGGAMYQADDFYVVGASNVWSIRVDTFHNLTNNQRKNCQGGDGPVQIITGHPAMALWFDGSNGLPLVRNNVGAAAVALNTMTTPLVFNSPQTADTPCNNIASLAGDSQSSLLYCDQSKVWKQISSTFWKTPVAYFADLPASNNSNGDVRATLSEKYNGAYMWNNGAWAALGVDRNGNLTVPKSFDAGSITSWGNVFARDALVSIANKANYGFDSNGALVLGYSKVNDACKYVGSIGIDFATLRFLHCEGGGEDGNGYYPPNWVFLRSVDMSGDWCGAYDSMNLTAYFPCMDRQYIWATGTRIPNDDHLGQGCPDSYTSRVVFSEGGHTLNTCSKN